MLGSSREELQDRIAGMIASQCDVGPSIAHGLAEDILTLVGAQVEDKRSGAQHKESSEKPERNETD